MGDVMDGGRVTTRGEHQPSFVPDATWAQAAGKCEAQVGLWIEDISDAEVVADLPLGARLASEAVRLRTYAKVRPDGRRETWRQTVTRWGAYMLHRLRLRTSSTGALAELRRAVRAVFRRQIMPSMRALWCAGDVLELNDIGLYNCAFAPADNIAVFWEALYILMHGTGFGFSTEARFVSKLPIPAEFDPVVEDVCIVEDSTEGWRRAVELGVRAWFAGDDVEFDFSRIRPAGTPLRTKGGEASGPEPLRKYLAGLREVILRAGAERRQLRPIEVHDLLCLAASAVQVGGVRRSAMIGFSDRDDAQMRWAKHYPAANALGAYVPPERSQANNSWVLLPDCSRADFDVEWAVLQTSNAGERGIFSPARMAHRGVELRANPCVEIGLAWQDSGSPTDESGGGQFCNLTNVILRPHDTPDSAREKVALAAFLGTLQASCTRFRGIREGWGEVTRRDALLGVGLAGQADCPQVAGDVEVLRGMNALAVDANAWWAGELDIAQAAGVTCGKPDGNSSVFLGCSSGIHAHHSRWFLRRITISATSPISAVLRAAGVPCLPSSPGAEAPNAWLFEFPMKAPDGALVREDETALGLLDRLAVINAGWLAERGHNQSVTVNVRPDEWADVRERVWAMAVAGQLGGVSFSPDDGGVYYGTPLTSLTEAEYEARLAALPVVDWARLAEFETGVSEGAQTIACGGGSCEIV